MDILLLSQTPSPDFDAGYLIGLLSRLAHTTCGATLLGGLVYLRCVVAPQAADADDPTQALYADRRKSWGLTVAFASLLLIASGIYNLLSLSAAYNNLPKLYHPLFGVKLLLAIGVMFLGAVLAGKSALAQRLQGAAKGWLNLAIALAVVVFLLGAVLRSFRDLPGTRAIAAPAAAETSEDE